MPELPEVELKSRLVKTAMCGHYLQEIEILDPRIIRYTDTEKLLQMRGQLLSSLYQHGKYLFISALKGTLVLHFGMTGDVRVFPSYTPPPHHTKVIFSMDHAECLAYTSIRRFGFVAYTTDYRLFIKERGLGPHILDLTEDQFLQILNSHSGRIKSLLLNQSVWAGIGNLYADESLYQASIHPDSIIKGIPAERKTLLYQCLMSTLRFSISVDTDFSRFPPSSLLADRKGRKFCSRCSHNLSATLSAGRNSIFCPTCQVLYGG